MSAMLLKDAYVADDVITLNGIFNEENAVPLQKPLAVLSPNNHFLQSVSSLFSSLGKRTGKFSNVFISIRRRGHKGVPSAS